MATVVMDKWATQKMFAPEFDATATYAVGAWVCYGGKAWQCHTAVSSAGDWTGTTNWTEKPLAETLGDIKTAVDALVAKYSSIVVTCVTQDDVTVTGQTVTLRAGSAEGPVYDTRPYNGQPVTFEVPRDFRYFVEVSSTLSGHFAPTTATGTATTATVAVTLTYSDTSHITTFADIKAAVNACSSAAEGTTALAGIEIADTWISDDGVSSYSDPMICQCVQEVQDPEGNTHLAAIMMRKYATKANIQFDAPEQTEYAYASEATAIGGIYYWGYGKDYAQASTYAVNAFCGYKGGIWKCTTAVSAAETFDPNKWSLLDAKRYLATATYAVGDYAKYAGKVYECTTAVSTAEEFDPAKWTQKLSSGSFQTGARTALNLAAGATVPYSAWTLILRNDVNNTDIQAYGYNNYELSAWDQYLSSDEGLGLWWHASHVGDCPPAQAAGTRGYQAGCSAALLEYAKPIRVPVWPWNQSPQFIVRKLWLPSGTEMFGDVNMNEGAAFQKVKNNCYAASGWTGAQNGSTNGRKYYRVSATGSAVHAWLRSAYRDNSTNPWAVTSNGSLNTIYNASGAYAGLPACAIY